MFVCYHLIGNGTFPSSFPGQESQNAHCSQTSWSEEQPQESPPTWDTVACVGSKVNLIQTGLTLGIKKEGWWWRRKMMSVFCTVPIHNIYPMTFSIQTRSRAHSLMVVSFGARICALASEQQSCSINIRPIHLPMRACPDTYDTTTHHQGAINVLIKAIRSLVVIFVVGIFLCSVCVLSHWCAPFSSATTEDITSGWLVNSPQLYHSLLYHCSHTPTADCLNQHHLHNHISFKMLVAHNTGAGTTTDKTLDCHPLVLPRRSQHLWFKQKTTRFSLELEVFSLVGSFGTAQRVQGLNATGFPSWLV